MILYNIQYLNISCEIIIKNGVYNLMNNDLYLYYFQRNLSLNDTFKHPNTFFRIIDVSPLLNISFYELEEIYTTYKLGYLNNSELNFNRKKDGTKLWKFINIEKDLFVIENNKKCYIVIQNSKVFCLKIILKEASIFKLIKIYTEIENQFNINYKTLIDDEPIDILIKYIDLRDSDLNRVGIHQIEKDYDNEELRYSIRSILDNIPWVRNIYILMPNKKVRYFKNYTLINNKIIYIQDKHLLGYDSSNSLAFQFRYWKMKKFGISDNIIVLDDDCFITNKLNKEDFFYVENGKIVPLIITSNFLKINKELIEYNCKLYESKAKTSKEEQDNDIFNYSKYLSYSFLLKLFNITSNDYFFVPKFTHNAIPINLKDVEEIYNLINISRFKYSTLDCVYRHVESLQFQMLVLAFTFLKYNKKVKDIPYKFMMINGSFPINNRFSLFCINKGAGNFSQIDFYKERIFLEYLFPNPSPYEIIDYSFINISFNIVNTMDEIIKTYENDNTKLFIKEEFNYLLIFFILIFIFIILKNSNKIILFIL